jgi:hypothetical protein
MVQKKDRSGHRFLLDEFLFVARMSHRFVWGDPAELRCGEWREKKTKANAGTVALK